jgi:hypothetical protein
MPVALRTQGFTFSFYANDHDPPHVHARNGTGWCRIVIETLDIVDLGMKPFDQVRAASLVQQNRELLLVAWARFQARKRGIND